jgi:hypothetical protein
VYGTDLGLRPWLEAERRAYVLAAPKSHRVWLEQRRASAQAAVARLPADAWTRLSAGHGSWGARWYDGAWLPLGVDGPPGWGGGCWRCGA